MTMRFLKQNFVNTTSLITVDAVNTITVGNIIDNNPKTQWETVGYSGGTDTNILFSFSSSKVIDTIYLQNHNISNALLFFDGATANTLASIVSNSSTSNYITFATTTVSSVTIQVQSNFSTSAEHKIGEVYIGTGLLTFERNPVASDYKPLKNRKQVLHKMPGGGVSQFIISDKFKGQIKWKYLTSTFTSLLENIYDTGTAFNFVPFATSTAWDGKAFETIWTNNFDFRHSSNNKDAGFGGKIILEETA